MPVFLPGKMMPHQVQVLGTVKCEKKSMVGKTGDAKGRVLPVDDCRRV